ncbi:hypothetical protein TUM18999_01060 [Pseudomonas tohonis]|uniref:Uncharacterized protein n=1 Tax=Pseudomonas tohonis TaxID=2725477 RepID=A0A6J4DXT0_9PSED|nr:MULTISPECIES: hypothetical protein [Pseudomonas]UXY53103.1 hypothetical protein N9L84_00560 [Pseudomonas tohonis]BBP80468.1 hypothetical protein PHLH8_01100 [Pseudomonas sp. Pc102]BCG21915.1 hypothetical protein TUM18999_01060 [Pseudomonas tohonis]GJN52709.1 hypothetical protein TUM20286_24610 [Pseudomonas tohonis]
MNRRHARIALAGKLLLATLAVALVVLAGQSWRLHLQAGERQQPLPARIDILPTPAAFHANGMLHDGSLQSVAQERWNDQPQQPRWVF